MSEKEFQMSKTAVSHILNFGDATFVVGDDTSPVVDEHISRMWVDLQNLEYVTPLIKVF